MLRTYLTTGALALALSVPAFAQNSMSGPAPAGGAMKSDMSAMTCDQMMAKEKTMASGATGAKAAMAQKHMSEAQSAKTKGDDAGCKAHTQMAMDSMK